MSRNSYLYSSAFTYVWFGVLKHDLRVLNLNAFFSEAIYYEEIWRNITLKEDVMCSVVNHNILEIKNYCNSNTFFGIDMITTKLFKMFWLVCDIEMIFL